MLPDLALCPPIAFHVTLRPVDHRVIVRDAADRRAASGVILAQGDHHGLVLHGMADTHAHALLVTDRASAGRFAHDVETSLRWRLRIPVPFEPAAIRPIRTQGYLGQAFWYVADQDERHRLRADPARDGSSVIDLLGARVFLVPCGTGARHVGAALPSRMAAHLPRIHRADLLSRVGGAIALAAAPELEDLAEAAAAAVGAPHLRDRGPVRSVALCAAIWSAHRHGTSALSAALGVTRRTVQRHRNLEPSPLVLRALALQWRIRGHLRRQARAESEWYRSLPEASGAVLDQPPGMP